MWSFATSNAAPPATLVSIDRNGDRSAFDQGGLEPYAGLDMPALIRLQAEARFAHGLFECRCLGEEDRVASSASRSTLRAATYKWIDGVHRDPDERVKDSSDGDRQRDSYSFIQANSASPSAGMRPFPARQSTTACDGAT